MIFKKLNCTSSSYSSVKCYEMVFDTSVPIRIIKLKQLTT
jgi:hypothetical protein